MLKFFLLNKTVRKVAILAIACGACVFVSKNGFSNVRNVVVNDVTGSYGNLQNIDVFNSNKNDQFTKFLAVYYKSYSKFLAERLNDRRAADYFAGKSLQAYSEKRVLPENIYSRKLDTRDIVKIDKAYENLLEILNTDLPDRYGMKVANLQTNFDCWIERLSVCAPEDQYYACRENFYRLYNELNEIHTGEKCKTVVKKVKIPVKKEVWIPNVPFTPSKVEKRTYVKKAPNVVNKFYIKSTPVQSQNNNLLLAKIDSLQQQIINLQKSKQKIYLQNNIKVETPAPAPVLVEKTVTQRPQEILVIDREMETIVNNGCAEECETIFPAEIFFDFDKYDIKYEAQLILNRVADYIKHYGNGQYREIVVTGFTDTSGSMNYNKGLSNRRAEAIKNYLINRGVSGGKISTQGQGETMLKSPTRDGIPHPSNRRGTVEVLF